MPGPSRARKCWGTGSTRSSHPSSTTKKSPRKPGLEEVTDAETEDAPGSREALPEDRLGQVQTVQGLQEPHPDQEGAGPKAWAGQSHARIRVGPEARPGDAALRLRIGRRETEDGRRTGDWSEVAERDPLEPRL